MNKIKVTVEYEQPETDRFDALMAEYKAAKAVADEAKETLQPLIAAGFAAKHQAILNRLYKLGISLRQYNEATRHKSSTLYTEIFYLCETRYFKITCDDISGITIRVADTDFTNPEAAVTRYLVESWNHQTIEEDLRKNLEEKWQTQIKSQTKIPVDLQNTLTRIQEG